MSGLPIIHDNFTTYLNSVKDERAKISEKLKACPLEVDLALKLAKMGLELSKIDEDLVEKDKFVGAHAVSKRKFSCIMNFLKDKEIEKLDKKVNRLIHR